MKERFIRFMQGRYGLDQLSKFLAVTGVIVVAASVLPGRNPAALVFYLIGWILIIACYARVFSRNVTKRYAENQAFLKKTFKIREFLRKQKNSSTMKSGKVSLRVLMWAGSTSVSMCGSFCISRENCCCEAIVV